MDKEKTLIQKVINSELGNVPFHKGKLYIIVNAYLSAYEKNYLDVPANRELLSYCEETNSYLPEHDLFRIRNLFNSFSKEDLREIVLTALSNDISGYRDYINTTTSSIFDIAAKLLDIDGAGHTVVDLGSGDGGVLAKILINARKKKYVLKDLIGFELNIESAKVSQMSLDILSDGDPRPIIKIANIFDGCDFVCTRGYCFPPFGLKQFLREKSRPSKLFKGIELTNRNTSEWLFIDTLLNGLHEYGRAVALVSGRALFNFADNEYRTALLENGLLEGIIELPNGSLNFTGVKPYMLVFSHGNTEVKIIDASDAIDSKTKRFNKIEVDSNKVLRMYFDSSAPARDTNNLKELNSLVPSNVLLNVAKPKNGVPLNGLAEVFTGNQYTLGVFEKNGMLSSKPTGYRILTSSDIEDGIVDWKSLQSIVYEDNKFDKYAVRKNDLVITSKSSKVKTVVVDIEPKEKILVTGGMIIVRPDTKLLDPTYLKIFLDSEQGQNALKGIQKGSVIITINSKELSTILIPLIDVDKQIEKARKYNEKLSTLYALKQEARKLEDSLKNFYLDESEEE